MNGYAPYASHKMMTTALDDLIPEERTIGIECGLAFRRLVHERIFFVDLGWSGGMRAARDLYEREGLLYWEKELDAPGALGTDGVLP